MKIAEVSIPHNSLHVHRLQEGETIRRRAFAETIFIFCVEGKAEISDYNNKNRYVLLEPNKIVRIAPNKLHELLALENGTTLIVFFE